MLQKANCFLILMIMFCFGIIPSDLIRSITVLLLGRNARLDFWGKLLQFCLTRTQLSDQLSSCLFLRCSFSAHFFFLHSFAFIIHCLWSLHKIWGGINRLAAEPVFLGLLTFIWLILPQFFLTIYIHHRKVPYQIHF